MRTATRKFLILLVLVGLFTTTLQTKAMAISCCAGTCCFCVTKIGEDAGLWSADWITINTHIFTKLTLHHTIWFDYTYWQQHMLPAFMMMGEQLSAVGTQQVMIIGAFLDAKEAMETQRDLQTLHAKAHKDYHPSIGLCEFGTRVKTLAVADRKGELASITIGKRFIDRMTGNTGGAGEGGPKTDIQSRINQIKKTYCNPQDNNGAAASLCTGTPDPSRFNKDIDYVRTLYTPWTLDVDLSGGGTATKDEEDVFALASNLYGYESFERFSPESLKNDPSTIISEKQRAYLNIRSVIAKESVAQNSFAAMTALKSAGTNGSQTFLRAYLEQLGIPNSEAETLVGENPSYYAQMEILTKKVYQSPLFYTNLYDTPANVERKGVAIQALGLIQKFDLLKSNLRTEASLSVLLELSVTNMQNEIEDAIKTLGGAAE